MSACLNKNQMVFADSKNGKSVSHPPEISINQTLVSVEYQDLVAALNSTVSMGLFKIELLPDSHPLEAGVNLLIDGSAVVIPKKTLKSAFLSARQVFFDNLKQVDHIEQIQEAVFDASTILLLMMPEYLTAANARKRIITDWEDQSREKGRRRVIMDLWIMDSMILFLGNKHAKSPTLWSHRKWLMQRVSPPESLQMERACLSSSLRVEREVSVVTLRAAEIHSRNYYAWGYLRWLITTNLDTLEDFGQCQITQSAADLTPFTLSRLASTTMEWCLKHPSDTSGWSFLIWLITSTDKVASGTIHLRGSFVTITKNVLDSTMNLKLRNESVFVFLRTVISSQDMPPDIRRDFMEYAEGITKSESERTKSKSVAKAALKWLGAHSENRYLQV